MTHDEIRYDLLKAELELTQRQMDKYDQLSTTSKAWTITLWAASVGWALQTGRREIFFVSMLIVALFWAFDAINKTFRQDYKKRRDEVASALERFFTSGAIPPDAVSPKLPLHAPAGTLGNLFRLHVALPYLLLAALAAALAARF